VLGDGAPPDLLLLALDCEKYQALPISGGVWEQPAGLLAKMRKVVNVYRAYSLYQSHGNKPGEIAKWKRENEAVWNIIEWVEELRDSNG